MYLLTILRIASLFLNSQEPKTIFVLESNKDIIIEGECVVITASLLVPTENTVELQFTNLGAQVAELKSHIIYDNAFSHDNDIQYIEGVYHERMGKSYTIYKLLEIALCPFNSEDIEIPAQSLKMSMNFSDTIVFKSEPLKVIVNPLEPKKKNNLYQNLNYSMVGDFTLNEHIVNPKTFQIGDTIQYTMNLNGVGISFPIDIEIKDTTSFLLAKKLVERRDTIINNQLIARKTFQLFLIPNISYKKYELSNLFSWNYFSVKTKMVTKISSDLVIRIKGKRPNTKLIKNDSEINLIVGVDASESMGVEDYKPNRFGLATAIVNELNSEHCEYQVLLFSSEIQDNEGCTLDISDLKTKRKLGTAIGDLIWTSLQQFKMTRGEKRLIIIGDGDETAGSISAISAANLAKSLGVRIYCIGIGTSEPAPYYNKELNQFVLISDTFREDIFKEISSITEGKYIRYMESDSPSGIKTKLGL